MMNRNLQLFDSKGNSISEEDLLTIDVVNFEETNSFWNSNLGKHCKKNNVERIDIQLENCHPFLKLEYTISFIPKEEVQRFNDVTFLNYLIRIAVNQTKKESEDIDLSKPIYLDIKNLFGEYVKVGQKFNISKESINFKKIFEEDWITKIKPKVYAIEVQTINDGFCLKTIYKLKHADGSYFNRKERSCISEEDFNLCNESEKAWYLNEAEESSHPFKNNGEALLQTFLDMQK